MELQLSLVHHPDPDVAVGALASEGAYFRTCWGPLVGPLSVEVTDVMLRHVQRGPVETSVDALAREVFPDPVDSAVRSLATVRILRELDDNQLGSFRMTPTRAHFRLFRQVPLVPAAELVRLTDTELGAHVRAVVEVNERLAGAHRSPSLLPSWVVEGLDRFRSDEARPTAPTPDAGSQLGRLRSVSVSAELQALSL